MAKLSKDLEAEKAYIQGLKSTFKENEERQIQSQECKKKQKKEFNEILLEQIRQKEIMN